MSRIEYISPEGNPDYFTRWLILAQGLRLDGRRANELRTLKASVGILPAVDGSSLFELGNTRVLATVYGPREPRQKSQILPDKACITARFHAATFSSVGGERRKQARQDRRLTEWGRYLQDVFETAIIAPLFPRSLIEIYVEVLNADGSVLAAAINAVSLALINAGVPLYDYVVATSVLHLANSPLLDANRLEEGGASRSQAPSMTIASYGRRPEATLLMTQDCRMSLDKMEGMTQLARAGLAKIFQTLDHSVVLPYLHDMAERRAAPAELSA